jgi:acyl-CoA synthetase (AMP-forming)/AMP-acid ligase II
VSVVVNPNIARHLEQAAVRQPTRVALKVPRGRTSSSDIDYLTLSFAELSAEVDAWCHRLTAAGVKQGDRTLVMVRQGLPLIASAFALFKLGAVPVIIDPGMGLKSFLACVGKSRPRVLVGIPLAQLISRVARRPFSTVRIRASVSSSLTARLGSTYGGSRVQPCSARAMAASELAAILFTSGSTGTPKGVCYEHGMFDAQVRIISETYAMQAGEIDLPMLPIFALFNPALGMTTIVPELDPRRPGQVDPAKIVQAIQQENVTNSFGSPTLWRKIGSYCIERGITLPSLRRVLCAGAPVPAELWKSSRTWMPSGRLHSPYGATEALPVSSVSSDEVSRLSGTGACVGRPLPANRVKIIPVSDQPISSIHDVQPTAPGEWGEIIVAGPTVTKAYDSAPEATAAAKISDPALVDGAKWHRMGDCGYFDSDGRLWFCGRKAERVVTRGGTLHTEPCEQVFRAHPQVARCALIGVGELGVQRAAIVVEPSADTIDRTKLARELGAIAKSNVATQSITRFYFHPGLPVDVRHNAKIHRLALARWAVNAPAYDC